MATVALTPAAASDAGVDPSSGTTAATAGNTYTVKNQNRPVIIYLKNAGGSPAHATFQQPAIQSERKAGPGKVITVAAGGEQLVGPHSPDQYGDPLQFTVDAALTVLAVQLPTTDTPAVGSSFAG
jgi:hypothetical protein